MGTVRFTVVEGEDVFMCIRKFKNKQALSHNYAEQVCLKKGSKGKMDDNSNDDSFELPDIGLDYPKKISSLLIRGTVSVPKTLEVGKTQGSPSQNRIQNGEASIESLQSSGTDAVPSFTSVPST